MWYIVLSFLATLVQAVVGERMRRTKGGGDVVIPVSGERDEDGGLSTGTIVAIVFGSLSGLVCLCKMCYNEEEDEEEHRPPSQRSIEKDNIESNSFDTVLLGAMTQMAMVTGDTVTDTEIGAIQKLYLSQAQTIATARYIQAQVNEQKKSGDSIEKYLGSLATSLTSQQKDSILKSLICVALVDGSLLNQAQTKLLTEVATALEVPISHVNDLLYTHFNTVDSDKGDDTVDMQDKEDEEMGMAKNVSTTGQDKKRCVTNLVLEDDM